MNQRAAKRDVCWHAAAILESALASNADGNLTDVDDPNEDRLCVAWRELIAELERRGSR